MLRYDVTSQQGVVELDLYEELKGLVELLDDEGVDYALCGGVAAVFHGHVRFTEDIDLLVRAESVERITELVKRLDFTLATGPMPLDVGNDGERVQHRISKLADEALPLDLVVVAPALEPVWADRELLEWQGRKVKVVSAEGLAAMKRLVPPDMSPDAIDRRLRELAELHRVGLSIERARQVGKADSEDERKTSVDPPPRRRADELTRDIDAATRKPQRR